MPRVLRARAPGVVHHVISRFVDRSWQLSGDLERDTYVQCLSHALARSDWTLLGFALMSNHLHLVLESGDGSLESWTKSANSNIARQLNRRHGRLGPVFADRPTVEAIAPERVPYVLAYVHNNPVRARLVSWAGDIGWTSHRAYLNLEPPRAHLCVARGLDLCGYADDSDGRVEFDGWVRTRAGEQLDGIGDASRVRRRARMAVGSAAELGTPERSTQGLVFPIVVPAHATLRSQIDIRPDDVLEIVHRLLGVDARGRNARDHHPGVSQARRVALSVWERTGRPRVEMARALGIAASSASNLVRAQPSRVAQELVERVWMEVRRG